MIRRMAIVKQAGTISPRHVPDGEPAGLIVLLFLSAWCGLVAGLLEVGTIVVRKQVFDPNHLYGMSRHFVWLIPVSNLCVFLALGLLGMRRCPGLAAPRSLAVRRVLCARWPCCRWSWSPFPGSTAWPGCRWRWAWRPGSSRSSSGSARASGGSSAVSFPVAVGTVVILGASLWIGDRIKRWREEGAAVAAAGVAQCPPDRAGHRRGGPPEPPRLRPRHQHDPGRAGRAGDSIRFAPGRPHHGRCHLMRRCSQDDGCTSSRSAGSPRSTRPIPRWPSSSGTGATRRPASSPIPGIAPAIRAWAAASLITRITSSPSSPPSRRPSWSIEPWRESRRSSYFLEDWLEFAGLQPYVAEALAVVGHRSQGGGGGQSRVPRLAVAAVRPERPFFAFLNYFDAHYPYRLPPGRFHRFGVEPTDARQRILIQHWWELDKTRLSPQDVAFAADAYDDCIADLDEQLGKLVDELGRRGVLERTWLIVTADHGESFGEHAGVFCHGTSLYRDRAARPAPDRPARGARRGRSSKRRSACGTWPRRSSTWSAWRPARRFPGQSLARYWERHRRRRDRSDPPIPRWPRWSRTTRAIAIPGACPGDSGRWGP